MVNDNPRRLLPRAIVEVRPWQEIAATLDEKGMLEALPFMPEMLRFCGRRFTVTKRLERTCEETEGGMRRIQNAVFLDDLRCDGSGHGGCQKACMIFWKTAWLREAAYDSKIQPASHDEEERNCPVLHGLEDGWYLCQSTELFRATTAISPFDLGSYLRDILAETYSTREMGRILGYASYLRLRRLLTGKSYRVVKGVGNTTPVEVLNLQPGEWVRVKSKEQITASLDQKGKNQGLAFTVEMIPFCGRTFRVLNRLERMIHEPTRRLVQVKNTVILEGVTCDGCHIMRGGCPRANFHFWREAWLQRVAGRNKSGQPKSVS